MFVLCRNHKVCNKMKNCGKHIDISNMKKDENIKENVKIEVDISKKSVKLCGIQINRTNAVNRIPLLEGNASQRVIGRWKMTCIF